MVAEKDAGDYNRQEVMAATIRLSSPQQPRIALWFSAPKNKKIAA